MKWIGNSEGSSTRAYQQAAAELDIKLTLGQPKGEHRKVWGEYGLFVPDDQYVLTGRLYDRKRVIEKEMRDDPTVIDRGGDPIVDLTKVTTSPPWLILALPWLILALLWYLWYLFSVVMHS